MSCKCRCGAKGWVGSGRGTRLPVERLSLNNLTKPAAWRGTTQVWQSKLNRGRPIKKVVPRFQAERTFAWFQKKYRRLVVRWDRSAATRFVGAQLTILYRLFRHKNATVRVRSCPSGRQSRLLSTPSHPRRNHAFPKNFEKCPRK